MAVIREEKSNSKLKQLLPPIAVAASRDNITAVDVSGFESSMFIVNVGAAAEGAPPTEVNQIQIRLKHSNDNVNFVDCVPSEIINATEGFNNGTFAAIKGAPEADTSFMVGYIGDKRYVRPAITVTGDDGALGGGVLIGITAILHNPKYRPIKEAEAVEE